MVDSFLICLHVIKCDFSCLIVLFFCALILLWSKIKSFWGFISSWFANSFVWSPRSDSLIELDYSFATHFKLKMTLYHLTFPPQKNKSFSSINIRIVVFKLKNYLFKTAIKWRPVFIYIKMFASMICYKNGKKWLTIIIINIWP